MSAPIPSSALFAPIKLGPVTLKHRIVMAPLTRCRADPVTQALTPLGNSHAEYYGQRATPGGLLITEATFISPSAAGYARAPGLWSEEQIAAWKPITEAVHRAGGLIFAQLWALGRVAPPTFDVLGTTYVRKSASATTLDETAPATPLTAEEIKALVADFGRASRNAVEQAGFDGVEIHAANGYLLDQFLQASSNKRTDEFGGTLANRFRFPLAVAEACSAAIGPDRVGIRLSPFNDFQDMGKEPDPNAVFVPFVEALLEKIPNLAYVHVVEGRMSGFDVLEDSDARSIEPLRIAVRERSRGITRFISAGGFSPETGIKAADESGELIAYGRHFISNPDLVERVRNGHPLTPYDRSTFYTETTKGYTDYPTYQANSL